MNEYRKPDLDEYELPVVACMIPPSQHIEGPPFIRVMIDELWESQSTEAIWAIQTIAKIWEMYVEASNKLHDIEAILRK